MCAWFYKDYLPLLIFLVLPQVVDSLLDITKMPRKPQYKMAAELPLILRSCLFDKADFMCSPGLSCRTFGANFQKYFFSIFFLTRYLIITASKMYHLVA